MSTIERLADCATQDNIDSYIAGMTQFRQDLLQAATEYAAVVAENERLREALADVKWRIDDITAMVIQRTDDEFSVPVLNLKSAGRAIDAALADSQEVGNG